MGKKLIIKGADFSTNGIIESETTWYFSEGLDISLGYTAAAASSAWALNDTNAALLYGKNINRIKFVPANTGNFRIYKTSSLSSLGDLVATINVVSGQQNTVVTARFDTVTVAQGERFVFPDLMKYGTKSGASFYKKVGHNDYSTVTGYCFPWAFGYNNG